MTEAITIIQPGYEKERENLIPLVPENYDFIEDSKGWGKLMSPGHVPQEVLGAFEESFRHKLAPVPQKPYFQVLSCLGKEEKDVKLHQSRGVVKIAGIFRVSEKGTPQKRAQNGWRIRCKPVFIKIGSLADRLRRAGINPTDLQEHGLFLTQQKITGFERKTRPRE